MKTSKYILVTSILIHSLVVSSQPLANGTDSDVETTSSNNDVVPYMTISTEGKTNHSEKISGLIDKSSSAMAKSLENNKTVNTSQDSFLETSLEKALSNDTAVTKSSTGVTQPVSTVTTTTHNTETINVTPATTLLLNNASTTTVATTTPSSTLSTTANVTETTTLNATDSTMVSTTETTTVNVTETTTLNATETTTTNVTEASTTNATETTTLPTTEATTSHCNSTECANVTMAIVTQNGLSPDSKTYIVAAVLGLICFLLLIAVLYLLTQIRSLRRQINPSRNENDATYFSNQYHLDSRNDPYNNMPRKDGLDDPTAGRFSQFETYPQGRDPSRGGLDNPSFAKDALPMEPVDLPR